MDATGMMAGGLVGALVGIVLVVVIGAALLMLASKFVMGNAASFGSAAIAVIVSGIATFAVQFGIGAVAASVPGLMGLAGILQLVLGVLVTCAIYTRLLDPKPTFVQALLIWLIQIVIGIIIAVVCFFVATSVFHVAMPDLSQYMTQ